MKKNIYSLGLLVVFLFYSAPAGAWTGPVLEVREGDLLRVQHPDKGTVELMLYGIDAPDKGQPYFGEARDFLAGRLEGKDVEVREFSSGQKIETAVIVHEGGNVNEQVLDAGFGWVYEKYCRQDFCFVWKNYEKRAREMKVGLWQDEDPVPPYEWRQKILTKIFRVFLWIVPPWSD